MNPSWFGRVVDGVQWAVGVAAAAAVVMLFSLGGAPQTTSTDADAAASEPTDPDLLAAGQAVYAAQCATCHGIEGEGGVGPSLVAVRERYETDEQIAVVTLGRGAMQSFAGQLTRDEITAVVAYTRNGLS